MSLQRNAMVSRPQSLNLKLSMRTKDLLRLSLLVDIHCCNLPKITFDLMQFQAVSGRFHDHQALPGNVLAVGSQQMAYITIFPQDPFHLAPSSEWLTLFQVLLLYVSSQEELPEHYWLEKPIRVSQLKLTFNFMIFIFIYKNSQWWSIKLLKNWKASVHSFVKENFDDSGHVTNYMWVLNSLFCKQYHMWKKEQTFTISET